jgi:adenine-specific DNA glycosylase
VKTKKKAPLEVTIFQLWAEDQKSIRLTRREETGLFGGMWELPGLMVEGRPDSPDKKAMTNLRRAALGAGWKTGKEIARLVRILTHRKILFVVYRALSDTGTKKAPSGEAALWASKEDLAALPISTAQRAVIDVVREEEFEGQGNLF